jgi:hypothetical protein
VVEYLSSKCSLEFGYQTQERNNNWQLIEQELGPNSFQILCSLLLAYVQETPYSPLVKESHHNLEHS